MEPCVNDNDQLGYCDGICQVDITNNVNNVGNTNNSNDEKNILSYELKCWKNNFKNNIESKYINEMMILSV